MAKLHIPAPDDGVDRSDVDLAMFVVIIVGLMCAMLWVRHTESNLDAVEDDRPADMPRDIYDELADQRELSKKFAQKSAAELAEKSWDDEEIPAAMRFGPREATEAICEQNVDAIRSGTLSKSLRMELEKTLDRRTDFAPWTCMTRLYLAGELTGSLATEMTQWWSEVVGFHDTGRITSSVIEDFRASRERPENPAYYAWLRTCALNFDYAAHAECQKMLAQMAPAQGADLLGVIEKHWDEGGTSLRDMEVVIEGLGFLARNGQPHSFKIAETDALPDYDVDFRQAAVGYLCRLMNTPTAKERDGAPSPLDPVPELAGTQLSKIALVGARAYEEKLLMRWRESCRQAHGGGYNEDRTRFTPVPVLAVWDGDVTQPADYRLSKAVEWGSCKLRDGHPQWWCLAEKWQDNDGQVLDVAARHAFVKTRYMEWEEQESRAPDKPKR